MEGRVTGLRRTELDTGVVYWSKIREAYYTEALCQNCNRTNINSSGQNTVTSEKELNTNTKLLLHHWETKYITVSV